jgi:hypothetical protein
MIRICGFNFKLRNRSLNKAEVEMGKKLRLFKGD